MKHVYIFLLLSFSVAQNTFAANVVDINPTSGRTIINGKECGYYVTSDKKFIHIDCKDELITASYQAHLPTALTVISEDSDGSFEYTDKQGVKRVCHYKILCRIDKKNMTQE